MRLFAAIILMFSLNTAFSQTLFPGSDAPKLSVGKWVKGTPVTHFEKNKIYVVEFWATWCGPCKVSIPHLTELAHEYKNKVNIIGVSIAEANTDKVAPFVEQMGAKMDYNVAYDEQETPTARSGYMSKNWLEAAGLRGIPAAFVVGKTGKIEFIGGPDELDSVLALMVQDKWNGTAYASKWKSDKEAEAKSAAVYASLEAKIGDALKQKDKKALYQTLDIYLKELVQDPSRGWSAVNEIVWVFLADPQGKQVPAEMKDPSFGIPWMEKLNTQFNFKQPAFLDTLAWLYHATGNKSKAVETEQKALAIIPVADPSRPEYEKALSVFNQ